MRRNFAHLFCAQMNCQINDILSQDSCQPLVPFIDISVAQRVFTLTGNPDFLAASIAPIAMSGRRIRVAPPLLIADLAGQPILISIPLNQVPRSA